LTCGSRRVKATATDLPPGYPSAAGASARSKNLARGNKNSPKDAQVNLWMLAQNKRSRPTHSFPNSILTLSFLDLGGFRRIRVLMAAFSV